jgi:thymidylate synthase
VYEPHWEKGQKIAASVDNYKGMGSPRFTTKTLDGFDLDAQRWFATEEAVRTGKPITVDAISDPMLRAWMRVIQWWWTGDERHLDPINGTALYHAAKVSLQPPARVPDGIVVPFQKTPFLDFVIALHEEKHAAYGDSWKRRGEMLGIMANIARKIDRLGVGGAGDTAADTAIDLLVYLVKYRLWLTEFAGSCSPLQGYSGLFEGFTDNPEYVAALLRQHSYEFGTTIPAPADVADSADLLRANFEDLEHAVTQKPEERATIVDYMIDGAMVLANALWLDEQHA